MNQNVSVRENLNAEEEYQQIRDNMFLRLDKALKTMKGKYIYLDTWNGAMFDLILPQFQYNCSPNCQDQLLLNFKDEDENILRATVKLEDIYDIEIMDNIDYLTDELDKGETEYYCECIRIELQCGLIIRLQVQW